MKPKKDNMLKVSSDGRKAALDIRLTGIELADTRNTKANAVAEEIYNDWLEGKEDKLTQVVFCNLSTPNPNIFNVYDEIRNRLLELGIPENEIDYIHNSKTDIQKAKTFEKVRNGEIRVFIGSINKMGAGTNIQDRLKVLHEVDPPWRPSDIEQGEGRILRQGNNNDEIVIKRYITKRSFDAYMWQTLETKQKFISQLYAGSKEIRSMADLDNTALNFGEIKAIATDNKDIMEKFKIDMEVQELKLKERTYNNQRYTFEDKMKITLPKKIELTKEYIEVCKKDLEVRNTETPKEFCIEINNKIFKDTKEAGEEIIKSVNSKIEKGVKYEIGTYRGFKICLENKFNYTDIHLIKNRDYEVDMSKVPSLNIQRLDEELAKLEKQIEKGEQNIIEYKREIEQCKIELEKPFADADKLKELLLKQSELNAKLNLDDRTESQILIADEVEEENDNEEYTEEYNEYEETEYCNEPDIVDDMFE